MMKPPPQVGDVYVKVDTKLYDMTDFAYDVLSRYSDKCIVRGFDVYDTDSGTHQILYLTGVDGQEFAAGAEWFYKWYSKVG